MGVGGGGQICTESIQIYTIHLGGDEAQLVEHRADTPLAQVRFHGSATDFSPRVNCQCSFVGNHEEVQHQHKSYPSHQKPL